MMATCKEDRQWSGKKIERGEGLKTLECLRGRLLAERQASRSAKEEAESMGKKLIELENQIRKETELRNKAEKRLKLLIKKLESLNITSISVSSEHSTSSEISTISSVTKETEGQELRSESLASRIPESQGEKLPDIITTSKQCDQNKINQNAPDRANASPNYESPNNSCTDAHRSSQISRSKDLSFSVETKEREPKHYIVDNMPALVPATLPAANSETGEMKVKATDVHDTLKHIRGNAQSPFGRRNQMKAIMSM